MLRDLLAKIPGFDNTENDQDRLQRIRVPDQDIVLFARQMSALYKGGIPLVQCLDTLSDQNENPQLGELLADIATKLTNGFLFSTSMAQYPKAFPKVLQVMVRIGEESGVLGESLESAAQWLERDFELKRKIKGALNYPLFIFALTGVLTLGLFYGVMPAFLKIFEEMKVDLPLPTQVVLAVTRWISSPLFWILLVVFIAFAHWQARIILADERLKRQIYEVILLLPLWGKILHYGSVSRFCGAARTLLTTGVNLIQTLSLSGAVCGNPVIEHDVRAMINAVKHGEAISEFMSTRPEIYNSTTINFLSAGEETSSMPEMFAFASDYNALEAESQIEALKVAIEPLMLATIAFVVGGIVLSIFLPLYGFLNKL